MTLFSDTHRDPASPPCVLITGAGRNVGAYLANRFLDDGFAVAAHYRTSTDDTRRLDARGVQLYQGEFTDYESCTDIADRIAGATPGLRAIVHNASAFRPTGTDSADAATQFQRFFEVHMLAPYILNTRLADRLAADAASPADIIHITDIYADNPAAEYDIYCATKAGLQNLTLAFAKRLAPRVKVNAVQPGPLTFETWHDDDSRRRVLDTTPLGRLGEPESIYASVRAIMANDYQTGAVIPVDGGRRLGSV